MAEQSPKRVPFVAVVGHGPLLDREDGASATLRQLGAAVRTLDLWDDPVNLFEDDPNMEGRPRALLFEALDRPDLASAGAGETPIIAVAPAIAIAVFDVTGQRLRTMPMKLR